MRGKPNNGLATCVTWLMVGIAAIGVIEVGKRNYRDLHVALTMPDMTEYRKNATKEKDIDFRHQQARERFRVLSAEAEAAYIKDIQGSAMRRFQMFLPFSLVLYMFFGLIACAGVWLGRVIRGKQPDQGAWRAR